MGDLTQQSPTRQGHPGKLNPLSSDKTPVKRAVDTIIFDLDGVLVDTGRDIALAANYTLKTSGLPELPVETIISFIGGGAESILRQCLGDKADALIGELLPVFKSRYSEHCLDETRLYSGVPEVLAHYRSSGKQMAVATNKVEKVTRRILEGLEIAPYFQVVVGPESITHRKPHPEALLRIMQQFGADPSTTIMIGDTEADILAGKAAGTLTCGVTYGYGRPDEIENARPDFIVSMAQELTTYVE